MKIWGFELRPKKIYKWDYVVAPNRSMAQIHIAGFDFLNPIDKNLSIPPNSDHDLEVWRWDGYDFSELIGGSRIRWWRAIVGGLII